MGIKFEIFKMIAMQTMAYDELKDDVKSATSLCLYLWLCATELHITQHCKEYPDFRNCSQTFGAGFCQT